MHSDNVQGVNLGKLVSFLFGLMFIALSAYVAYYAFAVQAPDAEVLELPNVTHGVVWSTTISLDGSTSSAYEEEFLRAQKLYRMNAVMGDIWKKDGSDHSYMRNVIRYVWVDTSEPIKTRYYDLALSALHAEGSVFKFTAVYNRDPESGVVSVSFSKHWPFFLFCTVFFALSSGVGSSLIIRAFRDS